MSLWQFREMCENMDNGDEKEHLELSTEELYRIVLSSLRHFANCLGILQNDGFLKMPATYVTYTTDGIMCHLGPPYIDQGSALLVKGPPVSVRGPPISGKGYPVSVMGLSCRKVSLLYRPEPLLYQLGSSRIMHPASRNIGPTAYTRRLNVSARAFLYLPGIP